jgi:hypothetical protein
LGGGDEMKKKIYKRASYRDMGVVVVLRVLRDTLYAPAIQYVLYGKKN